MTERKVKRIIAPNGLEIVGELNQKLTLYLFDDRYSLYIDDQTSKITDCEFDLVDDFDPETVVRDDKVIYMDGDYNEWTLDQCTIEYDDEEESDG
jgi:hypothetical protein